MRAVKSKDTGPEMIVRRLAFSMGFRYRLHRKNLPGKPDLAFISQRKVIYVNGCFWHGHDCSRGARVPKQNNDYWVQKIFRNKTGDQLNLDALAAKGWRSIVIWECELKKLDDVRSRLAAFLEKVTNDK